MPEHEAPVSTLGVAISFNPGETATLTHGGVFTFPSLKHQPEFISTYGT